MPKLRRMRGKRAMNKSPTNPGAGNRGRNGVMSGGGGGSGNRVVSGGP